VNIQETPKGCEPFPTREEWTAIVDIALRVLTVGDEKALRRGRMLAQTILEVEGDKKEPV
jgi:hypothetical protein